MINRRKPVKPYRRPTITRCIYIFFHRALYSTRYLGIVALIALSGGCCTQAVLDTSKSQHTYLFNPSAVYQLTNEDRVAIEGAYSNPPPTTYLGTPRLHGYLILSTTDMTSKCFWTNGIESLTDIKKVPKQVTLSLKPRNTLPSSYEKTADLPPNDIAIEIDQTHPNRAGLIFMPFAIAIDIALLPIELPVICAFAKYGPG